MKNIDDNSSDQQKFREEIEHIVINAQARMKNKVPLSRVQVLKHKLSKIVQPISIRLDYIRERLLIVYKRIAAKSPFRKKAPSVFAVTKPEILNIKITRKGKSVELAYHVNPTNNLKNNLNLEPILETINFQIKIAEAFGNVGRGYPVL